MGKVYYLRRDTLNRDDASAHRFARYLERVIDHKVEWANHNGCNCDDARAHRDDAQHAFESGEWE